ncbi:hypothetical protein IQ235_04715 [Oscillatoriales cyanobacterium LEGE 11467]|uniref:Uncharacterized protein n=1 Tax=Zarconia navalis LEGE 11467 TaxID=1828826 RepID=A0A928VV61_9CYAN|nr:hypothetical protein [Zarconia navalis]MBE9040094.1 hypothetical protein [Zarconia navalis LEGE 11467]
MTRFEFYLRAVGHRLIGTFGLILLWRYLWPTIYHTLEALARQDGTLFGLFLLQDLNNQFWQVLFLIFLTLWFYRYTDGFFREWYIARLKLHEATVAAVRWTIVMLWHLLYPIVLSLMMFWLLKHYTEVPAWLKLTTAWIFFFVALGRGWYYPDNKIAQIAFRLSFS